MRHFFLLFSFLFLLSCSGQYTAISPHDGTFTTESQMLDSLGADGEKYIRRDDLTTDVSRFPPKTGETYDHYRERVFNTLVAQELEIQDLLDTIEQKTDSIEELQSQLDPMKHHGAEMRLALSQNERGEEIAEGSNTFSRPLFQRYVVQKGDSLQRISHEQYGTYTGWLALYRFNHSRLPFGPNRIEEGTTLLIPDIEALRGAPSGS